MVMKLKEYGVNLLIPPNIKHLGGSLKASRHAGLKVVFNDPPIELNLSQKKTTRFFDKLHVFFLQQFPLPKITIGGTRGTGGFLLGTHY